MFSVLLRYCVIGSRRFQLSVVKPKPNQLRTSQTTQPILNHSKTKLPGYFRHSIGNHSQRRPKRPKCYRSIYFSRLLRSYVSVVLSRLFLHLRRHKSYSEFEVITQPSQQSARFNYMVFRLISVLDSFFVCITLQYFIVIIYYEMLDFFIFCPNLLPQLRCLKFVFHKVIFLLV